jgi:hypothetical protein
MVSDGVKSPAHNAFHDHDREGSHALLKPVSQVRILPGALPGAQAFPQLRGSFGGQVESLHDIRTT